MPSLRNFNVAPGPNRGLQYPIAFPSKMGWVLLIHSAPLIHVLSTLATLARAITSTVKASNTINHDRPATTIVSITCCATASSASTCEARTINHITHSLPRSCLTNSWRSGLVLRSDDSHAEYQSSTQPILAIPTNEIHHPFMSFDDWKEMMLRQAGQDPSALRSRNSDQQVGDNIHDSVLAHHAGLGEEDEISLNFDTNPATRDRISSVNDVEGDANGDLSRDGTTAHDNTSVYRSKDAGKTCKERFSYSSFDAGATILKTAAGAKNARAVLVENKDTYMLLECSAPSKYVIIELSDDILIDTIVLANFEFFSSMVRHFKVSVSDRYPVKIGKWRELGIFETRNSRDIQPFLIENPQIWAKYVRVEFLTHYGNEYYCPISLLRVHGSRMLDSWKDSETGRDEDIQIGGQNTATMPLQSDDPMPYVMSEPNKVNEKVAGHVSWVNELAVPHLLVGELSTCRVNALPTDAKRPAAGEREATPRQGHTSGDEKKTSIPSQNGRPSASSATLSSAHLSPSQYKDTPAITAEDVSISGLVLTSFSPESCSNTTAMTNRSTSGGAASGKSRTIGSAVPTAASATVQESFFNTITKRLQQAEMNLTLSLRYIEDQSRHVQEALQECEKQQNHKISLFFDNLNRTVLSELSSLRELYDQIWQSTVLALESQADLSDRHMMALSTRLNLLADEVVFQKRMAITQAVILLSCLFLVIFSRGIPVPSVVPMPVLAPKTTDIGDDTTPIPHSSLYRPARDSRKSPLLTHESSSYTKCIEDGVTSASNKSLLIETYSSPNLKTANPEHHHTSSPTETTDRDLMTIAPLPNRDTRHDPDNSLRRSLSGQSHISSRKLLPSLPEHPSPSHDEP